MSNDARIPIGMAAPTRCPCCGSTELDGPRSIEGEYRCLGCGSDVVGTLLFERISVRFYDDDVDQILNKRKP